MWNSAKMPLEEVTLQFPITILCAERQLGRKNRVNEIYKEIEKMLKRRLPSLHNQSAKNLAEKKILMESALKPEF